MIELQNFSKKYSKKNDYAAENVSLKIESGTITGLIGPNGSGKSTIMKAICGIHYATEGKITISDSKTEINTYDFPEKIHNLIGYVPENPLLPPEMSVSSFLDYAGQTHGLSEQQLDEAKKNVIKECNLEKFLHKKIKTLSKGQKQRVSFAQALIHNPPNLILDEPISGLDPAQILQMRELILKLSKEKAILMSTHILQEVFSLCTNLYILNEGKIVAQGTEEEIVKANNAKNLEDCFIKLTTRSDD